MKKGDKVKFLLQYATHDNANSIGIKFETFNLLIGEVLTVDDVLYEEHNETYKSFLTFTSNTYAWPKCWFELVEPNSDKYVEPELEKAMTGVKDSMGKVSYREINWDFVTAMAKRLNSNKIQFGGKYEPNNWKKDIDLNLIEDALVRHMIAFINGTDSEESPIDHLVAIAVNCQIFHYHLTNNKHDSN